jgi:hypothetical protein
MQTPIQQETKSPITPICCGILQRKCACGRHPVAGGQCVECHKKRLGLQRKAVNQREPQTVPSIVYEVLRSPGRPLGSATRAYMEPRFGQDLSQVRVHTNAKVAASARAVNALAYTIGQDVVFASGRYSPQTCASKRLLAHELTHVIQQQQYRGSPVSQTKLDVSHPSDAAEREADTAATQVIAGHLVRVQRRAGNFMINRQAQRFSAEGVSVVVQPSCAPATFGFATVEAATRSALDRTSNSTCIEESRRTRIRQNLTSHGLDIRFARSNNLQTPGACAEATGFSTPANNMTVGSRSFPGHPASLATCQPLASIILHEMVHLTRGVFVEGLPDSCENSCFGIPHGTPDLCRDIDVFGRRRPPVGDFPLPRGDMRIA